MFSQIGIYKPYFFFFFYKPFDTVHIDSQTYDNIPKSLIIDLMFKPNSTQGIASNIIHNNMIFL